VVPLRRQRRQPIGRNLLLTLFLFLFFWFVIPSAASEPAFSRFFLTLVTLLAMQKREYQFYVYILSSQSRNLYIGMTNDLIRRIAEHREMKPGAYTAQYNIQRLVYFERFQYVRNAIAREKELKDWTRDKKITLIEKVNPTWEDFAAEW